MLAQLAQRAMDAVAAVTSSSRKPQQSTPLDHDAGPQDSDTTMLTSGAAAGDDDDDKEEGQGKGLREEEEEEGFLENNMDHDDRPRTTAGTAPSEEEARSVQEEEQQDGDPTRGKDGKQYLVAGIYYSATTAAYAASLHQTPPARSSSSAAKQREKKKIATATDWRSIAPSKTTAFPPPIFHGETLLEPPEDDSDDDDDDDCIAARPFRLPFDILRDHWYVVGAGGGPPHSDSNASRVRRRRSGKSQTNSTEESGSDEKRKEGSTNPNPRTGKGGDKTTEEDILKREQSKKPPPYRYISKNVYLGRGPDKAANPAICMCRPPARAHEMGCGQDCINRMMQYCCDPKLCPCGPDRCGNPPLSKREGVPVAKDGLVVIWTGNRGFGLKTMRPIKRGEFVLEYRGEIISRNESYRRVLTDYKDSASYYFMDYDGFEVVDAGQRGNCARFINHSCGPNLEVVRWRLAQFEEYQMGLFALHDIPVGTELTCTLPNLCWTMLDRPETSSLELIAPSLTPIMTALLAADNYGWQDFSALAPKSTSTSTSSSTPTTTTTSAAVDDKDTLSPAEAIVLGNGTAIDPARQRCYCGAAECSGFLGSGGRKKSTSSRVSTNKPDSKKTTTTTTTTASAKVKGKRKAEEEGGGGGGEEARPAAPPRLAFAQAKIRVVDHAKTNQPPLSQQSAPLASPAPPAAKKRRTSTATKNDDERTAARVRHLDEERHRVVGALRSGREAAKRAAGRLVGSLAPAARKGRAGSGLGGGEGGVGDSEEK